MAEHSRSYNPDECFGTLYVQCNNCQTVLKEAKKSKLNTKSYRTRDKSGIAIVINLKGNEDEIREFSKSISSIRGVAAVRCVLTKY